MCYYTVTTDVSDKDGHIQAIMIIDTKDESDAAEEYVKVFNLKDYDVKKGVHIKGFENLLTDQVKRYIVKMTSNSAPLLSYQNMIHIIHDKAA